MAKRAILILLALAATATGETRTIAETKPGPLPPANYKVVIDGKSAIFYAAAMPDLVASGHLQAAPANKQDMRDEALAFVMQMAEHYGQADNALFVIIIDSYKPPHYEALIQGIRLTKDLHRQDTAR